MMDRTPMGWARSRKQEGDQVPLQSPVAKTEKHMD